MVAKTKRRSVLDHANIYGDIDIRGSLPKGYCHISSIDGISLHHWADKLNIKYVKAMDGFMGSRTSGYRPTFDGIVISSRSKQRLLEAIDARQEQKAKEARRKELLKEKKRIEYEQQKAIQQATAIDELSSLHPKLERETVTHLVTNHVRIYQADQLGYQHGVGSKTYWSKLGFSVIGNPTGCFIRGKHVYAVYSNRCLKPRKSKRTISQLRDKWRAKYGSEELLLANALKLVNRLQKVNRVDEVYSLKDQWITANQHNLTEGKFVRRETKVCWSCGGDGEYCWDECWSCGGTGLYSDRTLFEHNFIIDGQDICFHSYVKPEILSDGKGADLRNYGRPFNRSELPLPPQHLIVELIKELMA